MWRSHYESRSFFQAFPMALPDRLVRLRYRFPVIFDAYPIHSPFIFHIPDMLPLYAMIFPLMLLKSPQFPSVSYGFPMVSRINKPWISPTSSAKSPEVYFEGFKVAALVQQLWGPVPTVKWPCITVITGDFYGIISTNKLVKLGYKWDYTWELHIL